MPIVWVIDPRIENDFRNADVMSFQETLIEVWRQAFAENAKTVVLGTKRYPIVRTSKRKLRQVDFKFDGKGIRGLEQNPDTWAAMTGVNEFNPRRDRQGPMHRGRAPHYCGRQSLRLGYVENILVIVGKAHRAGVI